MQRVLFLFLPPYFLTAAFATRLPMRVTCRCSKLPGWSLQKECWRAAPKQFQLLNQWACWHAASCESMSAPLTVVLTYGSLWVNVSSSSSGNVDMPMSAPQWEMCNTPACSVLHLQRALHNVPKWVLSLKQLGCRFPALRWVRASPKHFRGYGSILLPVWWHYLLCCSEAEHFCCICSISIPDRGNVIVLGLN